MMTYDSLTNAKLTKFFKAGNYKKQIIKNIEIIGQRKLVIRSEEKASVFPSLRLRLQTMSARL